MSSDQNVVGLASGDVVCAKAIVRLVPSVRWDMGRITAIPMSPSDSKSRNQDIIEEDPDPHSHPDPQTPKEGQPAPKRLRIYDADLKNFGYTDGCPRCNFIKRGQIVLAGGNRQNEECRHRLDHEMREAGTEKLKRADLEHASRTQTQSKMSGKKEEEDPIHVHDAPMEPLEANMSVETPISAFRGPFHAR